MAKTPKTVDIAISPTERASVPAAAIRGEWAVHKPYVDRDWLRALPSTLAEKYGKIWTVSEIEKEAKRQGAYMLKGWTVTHAVTGMRAVHCADRESAMAALRALAPVTMDGASFSMVELQRIKERLSALGLRAGAMDQRANKPTRDEHVSG